MDTKKALEAISAGNIIWSAEYAKEVCQTLGVTFNEALVKSYGTDQVLNGNPRGVHSLELAAHVAQEMAVAGLARGYISRGPQAKEYARVVSEKLGVER